MPTFKVYRNGKNLGKLEGASPGDLKELITSNRTAVNQNVNLRKSPSTFMAGLWSPQKKKNHRDRDRTLGTSNNICVVTKRNKAAERNETRGLIELHRNEGD